MNIDKEVLRRFELLSPFFTEQQRRHFAAAEAMTIGYGGISLVARSTGVSRRAITHGIKELKDQEKAENDIAASQRIRKKGGGRKKSADKDPLLIGALESLIKPYTRGDPESPLRWTSKSLRKLACELTNMGHQASEFLVATLLRELGYSLQANRKMRDGISHPDRDAQFHYINEQMEKFLSGGEPAISVDTKKKELVGDFKNNGKELRPKGKPEIVRVHDFKIEELGKVAPYGVYDIKQNSGWVTVGTDHDTAEFAVSTIANWWKNMGSPIYPKATSLLITADGGGSNGHRLRLWKTELQALANIIGCSITVCHFPPGTSKWNKIEHKLFSFISQNWRGKPLISHEVILKLISATTTNQGLTVHAELDENKYPTGRKVTDKELAQVNIKRHAFHGDWNYTIHPA
jgi:hypothetical protein